MAKPEKPIVLRLPDKKPSVDRWVILGIDPSLSCTGVASMIVGNGKQWWYEVGSVKPESPNELAWIRARAMGLSITEMLSTPEIREFCQGAPTGLLLTYEAPTPGSDALATASICIRAALRADSLAMDQFSEHWELMTNAMTMRAIMGLTQKGNNKSENKAKAWEYLGDNFPGLDGDACDAVLFTMLGLWTVRMFRDGIEKAKAPEFFKQRFCDTTEDYKVVTRGLDGKVVAKGNKKGLKKGEMTKEHITTGLHGVLHRPEYWFPYTLSQRFVKVKDARIRKATRLEKKSYLV